MKRRKTLLVLALLALGVAVGWYAYRYVQVQQIREHLLAATAGADRMVIEFNVWPGSDGKPATTIPAVEVRDRVKVGDFLNSVTYAKAAWGERHACYGDARIEISRGEQKLAGLRLDHGHYLNWDPHDAMLTLTKGSAEKISSWRPVEGGPTLGQRVEDAQREIQRTLTGRADRTTQSAPK